MDFIREFIRYASGRADALGMSLARTLKPTNEGIAKAIELLSDKNASWAISPWIGDHLDEARPMLESIFLSGKLDGNDAKLLAVKKEVANHLAKCGSSVVDQMIRDQFANGQRMQKAEASRLACFSCSAGVKDVVIATFDDTKSFGHFLHLRILCKHERLDLWPESAKNELFMKIHKVLTEADDMVVGPAVEVLFKLNFAKAQSLIFNDEFIRGKPAVLEPLLELRLSIKPDLLDRMHAEHAAKAKSGKAVCQILYALARQKDSKTLALIEQARATYPDESHAIRKALMAWHDIDPLEALKAADPTVSYLPLDNEQMVYATVVALLGQVENGGIVQYYCNSYGNWVREAIESLKRLQLVKVAAVVEKTFAPFGASGPDRNRERRNQQLSSMLPEDSSEGEIASFKDADKLICADHEAIHERLLQFAIENSDHFRRPMTIP